MRIAAEVCGCELANLCPLKPNKLEKIIAVSVVVDLKRAASLTLDETQVASREGV
jgi:hypothetical protein